LRKQGLPPAVTEIVLGRAQAQLRAFADAGGQVLFGTDVGYMTEYDPADEYVFMQQAGLSYARVLAALTTAPAERFGAAREPAASPPASPRTWWCWTGTRSVTSASSPGCATRCARAACSTRGLVTAA
jgi:hypothetical protein